MYSAKSGLLTNTTSSRTRHTNQKYKKVKVSRHEYVLQLLTVQSREGFSCHVNIVQHFIRWRMTVNILQRKWLQCRTNLPQNSNYNSILPFKDNQIQIVILDKVYKILTILNTQVSCTGLSNPIHISLPVKYSISGKMISNKKQCRKFQWNDRQIQP